MTDTANEELLKKLDTLISLMAVSVLEGKPQKEQVELLGKLGLAPKDVASLLGARSSTVRKTLSRMRKGKSKPKQGKNSKKA